MTAERYLLLPEIRATLVSHYLSTPTQALLALCSTSLKQQHLLESRSLGLTLRYNTLSAAESLRSPSLRKFLNLKRHHLPAVARTLASAGFGHDLLHLLSFNSLPVDSETSRLAASHKHPSCISALLHLLCDSESTADLAFKACFHGSEPHAASLLHCPEFSRFRSPECSSANSSPGRPDGEMQPVDVHDGYAHMSSCSQNDESEYSECSSDFDEQHVQDITERSARLQQLVSLACATFGHASTLRLLLNHGTEVDLSATLEASQRNNPNCVYELARSGASVSDVRRVFVCTAACANASTSEVTRALAELRRRSERFTQYDAAASAASAGNVEVLRWLINSGFEADTLAAFRAACHGHLDVLRLLSLRGIALTPPVLSIAKSKGHTECEQLISSQVQPPQLDE